MFAQFWVFFLAVFFFIFHLLRQKTQTTTLMVNLFQHFAHIDHEKAMQTKDRIRELALQQKDQIIVTCSHDTVEFETLSGTLVS